MEPAPADFVKADRQIHKAAKPAALRGRATDWEPPVSCRPGCGACCIAPSISTLSKPAGVACRHLAGDYRCLLFGLPQRPACCAGLQASPEMCGPDRDAALAWLAALENATRPPRTCPDS
jgi:hypothetical protein